MGEYTHVGSKDLEDNMHNEVDCAEQVNLNHQGMVVWIFNIALFRNNWTKEPIYHRGVDGSEACVLPKA